MKQKEKKELCCSKDNPYIVIPASLGGILFVILAAFIVLGDSMIHLLPIGTLVWGFVILGSVALFFAYLSGKNKK